MACTLVLCSVLGMYLAVQGAEDVFEDAERRPGEGCACQGHLQGNIRQGWEAAQHMSHGCSVQEPHQGVQGCPQRLPVLGGASPPGLYRCWELCQAASFSAC